MGRVSGGVDVFFVVAGFLVATTLIGQATRSGRISFLVFWGRLIKRLLPAALFVLVAVMVATVLLLPKSLWMQTAEEVIASAVYAENWVLAVNAIDYLERDNALSPVQHFWALSVQGQFYLLWPLLVAAVVGAARMTGNKIRLALLGSFGVLFVASLVFSVVHTTENQAFAYFNSFARMWEFAMGGLLALALPYVNIPRKVRWVVGWLGLIGIVSCGFVLQVSTVFPGYAALWPAGCAVMVIAAGNSGRRFGADAVLGSRPLQYLGGISYSLYLWHWPVLVCYLAVSGRPEASLRGGLYVLGASLVLAAVTERLVERPFRKSKIGTIRPARVLAFGAALLVPVVLAAGTGYASLKAEAERLAVAASNPDNYPGARAMAPGFVPSGDPNAPLLPDPSGPRDLPSYFADGCHQSVNGKDLITCRYGAATGDRTIVLVGSSHAAQWFPAMEEIANRNNWTLVTMTKNACLFREGPLPAYDRPSCEGWNRAALKELRRLKPDLVVTNSTRSHRETGGDTLPPEYVTRWRQLNKAGIPVLGLRDTPRFHDLMQKCVERNLDRDPSRCGRPRDEVYAAVSPTDELKKPPSATKFVDLTSYLCTDFCGGVIGNVMVYYDRSHMTATFATTMADPLEAELKSAMGW